MRFALGLAAFAAFGVQPVQAATVIRDIGRTEISGSVNAGQSSFLNFSKGGQYNVSITFSDPVEIAELWQFQEAFEGLCNYECEWYGDSSIFDWERPEFTLINDTLNFTVEFGRNERRLWEGGGGYTQVYFIERLVEMRLNQGTSPVSFTGVVAFVPEPSTWALMLFGFGAVGVSMRRKRVFSKSSAATALAS